MKKKKPVFLRQDAHKKKRLSKKYRKPKGLHSKMRLKKKGYNRTISKGYRSPREVRGFHGVGLEIVYVSSVQDLDKVGKNQGALVTNVGDKKKLDILKKALEKSIALVNYRDAAKVIEKIETNVKERKQKKADEKKEKEKPKEKEKTIEKKIEESEEDKKQKEKKELDKLLTKKEA